MGAWAWIHSHSSFRSLANGREAAALAQSFLNSWTTAADGLLDPIEGQDTHQEPPSHGLLGRHFWDPRRATNNGRLERWARLDWREEQEEEEECSFGVPRVQ